MHTKTFRSNEESESLGTHTLTRAIGIDTRLIVGTITVRG